MHNTPAAVVFDFGGTLIHNEFDVAAGQRRMLELADGRPIDTARYAALAAEIDADSVFVKIVDASEIMVQADCLMLVRAACAVGVG